MALPQPTASRQLAVLKAAGIVESRREGSWVYHRLARQLDPTCRDALAALVKDFSNKEALRRDVARLLKARGPGACR